MSDAQSDTTYRVTADELRQFIERMERLEAEKAELLRKSKNEFVKFKWTEDEEDDTYFELRIKIDGITKDVALVVTDFADDEEEVEENTLLWTSQINDLKRVIGA